MSTQLGFEGHGYEGRDHGPGIAPGDRIVSKGEGFVVTHTDHDDSGRLVLVAVSQADGREVIRLGAASTKPAEWDVHFVR